MPDEYDVQQRADRVRHQPTSNGFDELISSTADSVPPVASVIVMGPDVTAAAVCKPADSPSSVTCRRCCGGKATAFCCHGGRLRLAVIAAVILTLFLVVCGLTVAVIHLQRQSVTCTSWTTHDGRSPAVDRSPGANHDASAISDLVPPRSEKRLPRHVSPISYRLELRIDPESTTFAGRSEIDVTVHKDTYFIVLHATSLLGLNNVFINELTEVSFNIELH